MKNIAKRAVFIMILLGTLLLWPGCATLRLGLKEVDLSAAELAAAQECELPREQLKILKSKPLYRFSEAELDQYLGYLQIWKPDLRERVGHLAVKMLGQPYEIYLLGEFPYELYDPQPLYCLEKSDCVVFSEHIYAMALSHDWPSFIKNLQRIRYKDGEIGILTRNHYTVYDWDRNNAWLVEDITTELAGEAVRRDTMYLNKSRFFKKWDIGQDIPRDTLVWTYIAYPQVPQILDSLQTGDFVNIVRGRESGKWVGHVGLIHVDERGSVNFLHSTPPHVREEPVTAYIGRSLVSNRKKRIYNAEAVARNERIRAFNQRQQDRGRRRRRSLLPYRAYFYGFRFLRLRENPAPGDIEKQRALRQMEAPDDSTGMPISAESGGNRQ